MLSCHPLFRYSSLNSITLPADNEFNMKYQPADIENLEVPIEVAIAELVEGIKVVEQETAMYVSIIEFMHAGKLEDAVAILGLIRARCSLETVYQAVCQQQSKVSDRK